MNLSRWLRPKEHRFGLETLEIAGPLQFTRAGCFAWYLLGAESWDFLALPARVRLCGSAGVPVGSARRDLIGRGTDGADAGDDPSLPEFRVRPLARRAHGVTLTQVEGGESWDDYLGFAQRRLRSTGLDSKVVAVGLWLGPCPPPKVREELIGGSGADPSQEALPYVEQLLQVDRIMRGGGFSARRATGQDTGVPVPSVALDGDSGTRSFRRRARWEPTDLAEFVDRRAWISRPYGPSVRIVSEANGASTERHAVVLSMGAMPDLHWPESGAEPWMLAASRLPFPVEWSLSGVLLKSSVLSPAAVFEQQRAEAIASHYAEHQVTPPPAVARAIEAAATNIDEITEGDARMSARWSGTIRLAVYGSSEDEALRRARDLVDHYGEQLRMPLGKTLDQAQVLREFIPGEPRIGAAGNAGSLSATSPRVCRMSTASWARRLDRTSRTASARRDERPGSTCITDRRS